MSPRLLLTTGEPAGIGPDLCVAIAQLAFPCQLAVIGDPTLLEGRARRLELPLEIRLLGEEPPPPHRPGTLTVWPTAATAPDAPGRLTAATAGYVLETIREGTRACLEGRFDALVTAPVHKAIINDAGHPFRGHTEFIADLAGGTPVMMLTTPGLRVALVTTHLPLAAVAGAISRKRLEEVIRVLRQDLIRRFGIAEPCILVAGLNPHAGEGGHLGQEEIEIIAPVLAALRAEGMNLEGPYPADTLFLPKYLERADAVLAMYHDQGLPVLKHRGFGHAVNVTLGLPLVRTSVDHGTALELAGTGLADAGSLRAAVETAIAMAMADRRPEPGSR